MAVCCVLQQGGIGINVAQMIVELIRDKRKIVDRITHQQIDEFVGLLQTSQVRLARVSRLSPPFSRVSGLSPPVSHVSLLLSVMCLSLIHI